HEVPGGARDRSDRRRRRQDVGVAAGSRDGQQPRTHAIHICHGVRVTTGVAGAETAHGVFPIFARYVATTMIGTNPDGTKYNDPGVPWVNYFNGGDAVHGFPRPSYGSPQSNGCVELPVETARTV